MLTRKEKLLRFIETELNGIATFTQIQRFVYDDKYGQGIYDKSFYYETRRVYESGKIPYEKKIKINPERGYFCGGLRMAGNRPIGYLLRGKNRLEKISRGKYIVIRESQNQ